MDAGYDGRQVVGIDLHRRRSVIVRMAADTGERLGTARIDNDPMALGAEIAKAGEWPEVVLEATYGWYWAVVAVGQDAYGGRAPYNCRAAPGAPVHEIEAFGGLADDPVGSLNGRRPLYGSSYATALVTGALANHQPILRGSDRH